MVLKISIFEVSLRHHLDKWFTRFVQMVTSWHLENWWSDITHKILNLIWQIAQKTQILTKMADILVIVMLPSKSTWTPTMPKNDSWI